MPDNNAAERALRGIAIGRKAWLFAGSDRGGERAAAIYSLIVAARLNDVDPRARLADVLRRIGDHPPQGCRNCCPGTGARKSRPSQQPDHRQRHSPDGYSSPPSRQTSANRAHGLRQGRRRKADRDELLGVLQRRAPAPDNLLAFSHLRPGKVFGRQFGGIIGIDPFAPPRLFFALMSMPD